MFEFADVFNRFNNSYLHMVVKHYNYSVIVKLLRMPNCFQMNTGISSTCI